MHNKKKKYLIKSDSNGGKYMINLRRSSDFANYKPEQPSIKINIIGSSNPFYKEKSRINSECDKESLIVNKSASHLTPEKNCFSSSKPKKDNVVVITSKVASKNSSAIQIDLKEPSSWKDEHKGELEANAILDLKKTGWKELKSQLNLYSQIKGIHQDVKELPSDLKFKSKPIVKCRTKKIQKHLKEKRANTSRFKSSDPHCKSNMGYLGGKELTTLAQPFAMPKGTQNVPFREILRLKYFFKDLKKMNKNKTANNQASRNRVFAAYIPKQIDSPPKINQYNQVPKRRTLVENIMLKDMNYNEQRVTEDNNTPSAHKKLAAKISKPVRSQTRASHSGFPQRNSIGALKMFTPRKLIKASNKDASSEKNPKWKQFIEKNSKNNPEQLSLQSILQSNKEKKAPGYRFLPDVSSDSFQNEYLNTKMIKKRLNTSSNKFYHTGEKFSTSHAKIDPMMINTSRISQASKTSIEFIISQNKQLLSKRINSNVQNTRNSYSTIN
ncbi:unnamed protein product [Moneuplotes crassus]|uniref:Uncharacterized protein n=1 Tax=Euplotes crassus TaxID=5936 RepID=A0AAD1XAF1_EUPCR|nr:unnamed protein product [Moneuplotes crassus]